jgi:lactate permease
MLLLTALLPFILLFFLMVFLKKPAYIAAPVTLVLTGTASCLFWRMDTLWFGVAFARGFLITLEILFIVFGAVFLVNVMQRARIFSSILSVLEGISKDKRVQAILIGWFLVSLIEGTAGFGTPAMIAAPLLVLIGFKPMAAVIIALVGNSVAVTFGAMGLPITIGIVDGLTQAQVSSLGNFVPQLIRTTAILHLVVGSFIPLVISVLATHLVARDLMKGFEIWKYALFAGLAFTLSSFLVAVILGPEFPSVLGALIGLVLIVPLTKRGFMLPKDVWHFSHSEKVHESGDKVTKRVFFRVASPYLLLILMLALSRIESIGLGALLQRYKIGFDSVLGTTASYWINPLYSPGFFLLIVSLFFFFYFRLSLKDLTGVVSASVKRIALPFWSLFFILFLVNIMIFSSNNAAGLPSTPLFLAEKIRYVGNLWPFFAPFVGMAGSFITGSSTVSNLLFAAFQAESALLFKLSPTLILSLQAVGSAAGNMIAVHNVLAALAVVGLSRGEGEVIKHNIIPSVVYVSIVGVIGLFFSLM